MTMAEATKEPLLRLQMFSQPRFLAAVRALIATVCDRLGFNSMQCGQISLAVDEALCNVITHGYNRREGIKIVIEDLASQVDPDSIQPRDLDDIRPGGLGVHIIREVMDEVAYERRADRGMRLTMTKNLHPAEATRPSGRQRVEP
jgi:anti-sigma regulatory factor (Ser/Thr protein kinase)